MDDAGEILMVNPAASVALGFDPSDPPTPTSTTCPTLFAEGQRLPEGLAAQPSGVRRGDGAQRPGRLPAGRAGGSGCSRCRRHRCRATTQHDRARAVLLIRDATHEHAQRQELAAFAGVVAHDLRNPLAAIDGWTELLADAATAASSSRSSSRSSSAGSGRRRRRMHGLIRTCSPTPPAATALEPRPARPRRGREADRLGRDAADFVTVGSIPPVHGDRVLLDQVLENLIGNALKYVAAGVRPHVRSTGGSSEPGLVRVCVADNGIGLPEGEHDLVFDEFHRVHTRATKAPASGWRSCRRIVTRHGGTVLARDNPTGGTVFEFTVPAAV